MSSGRFEAMFEALAAQGDGAFVPFVVLGDPSLEQSWEIIQALIEGGADALELGIPFSDPIADGPVNQAGMVRALEAGVTPRDCFTLLARVREHYPAIPIGLLLYANLLAAPGVDQFYSAAAEAGVDAILVADVPTAEAEPFVNAARAQGIRPVFIAPPNANERQLRDIARLTEGYTYVVTRAGITGYQETLQLTTEDVLDRLAELKAPPALLGFGIARPEHVGQALATGAAGAIAGSATVRIVEELQGEPEKLVETLRQFVASMKAATRGSLCQKNKKV
jgi:tryptophan synthase alpha chain